MTCADAKWLYDNCAKGTTVEIYDASNPWKTAKPAISGVTNITVLQGEEVDYSSNVSAVDVFGVALNVTTSGNVDVTTAGEYVIHYTATDSRGNTMATSATITVVEHPTDNEGSEIGGSNENEELDE